MASGPYQSNVLRFFVGQYRKGLDRHRRAVDRTRSDIALGTGIGAAMALVPVYAVVRASHAVRQKLTQSVRQLQLAATKTQAKKLIDFSPFKAFSAAPTRAHSRKDKRSKMTAVLSSDDFSAVSARETAEAFMLKTLVSVGDVLLPDQISSLAKMPTGWGLAVSRGRGWIRRLAHQMVSAKDDSTQQDINQQGINQQGQITGVASDLETRSLVLVFRHATVWNGFNPAQQAQLQSQLSRFFSENNTASVLNFPTINGSASPLAQPIYSFWIAVLRTIVRLRPRNYRQPIAFLMSGLQRLTGKTSKARLASDQILRLMETSSRLRPNDLVLSLASLMLPPAKMAVPNASTDTGLLAPHLSASVDANRAASDQSYSDPDLEANVISVDYIEHPLERLLKWADKILVWVERRWQTFLEWRSHLKK